MQCECQIDRRDRRCGRWSPETLSFGTQPYPPKSQSYQANSGSSGKGHGNHSSTQIAGLLLIFVCANLYGAECRKYGHAVAKCNSE